ncbi:MAG: M48 family metallopeptidase [Candidatus Kapaibacterium sp.]|nr:M48 family metalloprotease [Bacteroidota bacterium]
MIVRKHLIQAVFMFCLPVLVVGLAQCGLNVYAPSYDAKMGADLDKQIRANSKEYPILNDTYVRDYVQNIANQLTNSPAIKYRGTFPYKVEIINDPKTLNAFCTPGGYIYVYTGIIKALDNEASLAAVMGHEIAHAERRHATQRMTKAMGATLMLDLALGKNPDKTVEIAGNLFTGLALLKNSRDDEAESDEYSFKYMQSSKWYPGALGYFFEKVKGNGGGSIERLLSTHPLPQDRIDANAARVRSSNLPPPTESNLFARNYQEVKNRL